MNSPIDPILAAGVILNCLNLLFKHVGLYERFRVSDRAQGFISGLVLALLLLGLIRIAMGDERWEQLMRWKKSLFGG